MRENFWQIPEIPKNLVSQNVAYPKWQIILCSEINTGDVTSYEQCHLNFLLALYVK